MPPEIVVFRTVKQSWLLPDSEYINDVYKWVAQLHGKNKWFQPKQVEKLSTHTSILLYPSNCSISCCGKIAKMAFPSGV